MVQNAFKISAENLEVKYGYIRLYSIYRTSLDSTPEVKNIIDIKIPSSGKIIYTDSGQSGSYLTSDFLLYVGGEELVPKCMSQKNNTLFLGNISVKNNITLPPSLVANGDVSSWSIPAHQSEFQ